MFRASPAAALAARGASNRTVRRGIKAAKRMAKAPFPHSKPSAGTGKAPPNADIGRVTAIGQLRRTRHRHALNWFGSGNGVGKPNCPAFAGFTVATRPPAWDTIIISRAVGSPARADLAIGPGVRGIHFRPQRRDFVVGGKD